MVVWNKYVKLKLDWDIKPHASINYKQMKAFSVKKVNQKSIEEKKNEDKSLYNLAVESFLNYDLRSVSH